MKMRIGTKVQDVKQAAKLRSLMERQKSLQYQEDVEDVNVEPSHKPFDTLRCALAQQQWASSLEEILHSNVDLPIFFPGERCTIFGARFRTK